MTPNKNQHHKTSWAYILGGIWRTPLGFLGMTLTTACATLMILGIIAQIVGLIENPYIGVVLFMFLPVGMIVGLVLMPLAAFLRRRRWIKKGKEDEPLQINLSNPKHRVFALGFIILTVINFTIFAVIGYEGYHFTESNYFCGRLCHSVMEPEYTVYQRSPHARVDCVSCHIGSGADWFVKAKISGLRQVVAIFTGSYHRPIQVPIENLRPSRDTCENCHWPEKFSGKRVKSFSHFSNSNQTEPEKTDISLHIGGHNPVSGQFEGIHWHVSQDIEVSFLALDAKRTQIAKVRVKHQDGTVDEFVKDSLPIPNNFKEEWRVMECVDCHNRPTHIYSMPEDLVDQGLLSQMIDGKIPGIREDALTALKKKYASREEAQAQLVNDFIKLQTTRNPLIAQENGDPLRKAGQFLLSAYLGNIWPRMNIEWGTYKSHLGHQNEADGFGCFRCHDEEHVSKNGQTISQDCELCHDSPY